MSMKIIAATSAKKATHLTHYTNLQGLKGIITGRSLWLSHASFLNDPAELKHGLRQARQVLRYLLDESDRDPSLPVATERRKILLERLIAEVPQIKDPNAYVTCLCEEDDLLSQWRGYTPGEGVSISFEIDALRRVFGTRGAELHQVQYGISKPTRGILSELKKQLPDIVGDLESFIGERSDDTLSEEFRKLVQKLTPRFKVRGFQEEREWRIVVMDPERSLVEFRPRGPIMLPYTSLEASEPLLPISHITISPGVNDDAVAASLRLFLDHHEYKKCTVRKSSTPYRK